MKEVKEAVPKKKILGSMMDTSLDVGGAIWNYNDYKKEGDSNVEAGIKTAAWLGVDLLLPWKAQLALMVGMTAPNIMPSVLNAAQQTNSIRSQAYKGSFGGNYSLSGPAATMRQAGVDAIQRNHMNLRSVLGSEARMYDR